MTDQPQSRRPYNSETCREHIHKAMKAYYSLDPKPIVDKGTRGAIIGAINHIYSSDGKSKCDARRHSALGWLFGDPQVRLRPMSTKELNDAQWFALFRWLDLKPLVTPEGKHQWLPCQDFKTEAMFVLYTALHKEMAEEQDALVQLGFEEVANG